jgi:hypothetical protein
MLARSLNITSRGDSASAAVQLALGGATGNLDATGRA